MKNFNKRILKAKEDEKYNRYISILEEGVEHNDEECIYLLGLSYMGPHTFMLRENRRKALKLFRKNNNHFKSMAKLCLLAMDPRYCDNIKVYDLGIRILNSVANHLAKGYCFKYGFGTEQNMKEAFKNFLTSAEQGDNEGQYEVGCCFKFGKGVDEDIKKAYEWFLKAAEQNNSCAMYVLGDYVDYKTLNYEKSIYWAKKYGKWNVDYSLLGHVIKLDIYGNNCGLDSLIDLALARHYYINKYEKDEYLSWYFYKKTQEIDGKIELKKLEETTFKEFKRVYNVILTVLCIGKFSKYPKEVFMMIGKEIFGQIKK